MKKRMWLFATTLFLFLLTIVGYNTFFKEEEKPVNKSVNNVNKTLEADKKTSENKDDTKDTKSDSNNKNNSKVEVEQKNDKNESNKNEKINNTLSTPDTVNEPTIINGIMIINKKHPLPRNYNRGEDPIARASVNKLIADAQAKGLNVSNQTSGFRSFDYQGSLYNSYVAGHGKEQADTFSARPGYSEHQSGLAFDLIDNEGQLLGASGTTDSSVEAARWLAENAHKYGFIVRYKENYRTQTGYMPETWHIRYVGPQIAKEIFERDISLEEYLGVPGGDYN